MSKHLVSGRKQRNIVVIGFPMVGKTAICERFANDRFDEHYGPTFENTFQRTYVHKGQEIECMMKDTQGLSGQDLFRNEYGLGYHGYILVYSIASRRTLRELRHLHDKLVNLTGLNVPRVLVGNKMDLESGATGELVREVSTAEGAALAAEWGCAFVECSAKANKSIDTVFRTLLEEIDKTDEVEPSPSESSRCCIDLCPSTCCGMPEEVGENSRLERIVRTLITVTLAFGIAAIISGVLIGMQAADHEGAVLAYILFGFGFIVALISALGLFGVRQGSQEFLRVYSVSLTIVVVTEIVVGLILFVNLSLAQRYSMIAAIITLAGLVAEMVAIGIVCCYQGLLQPSHSSGTDYFNGYGGTSSPYSVE